MSEFQISAKDLVQSPHIYLQAAGSTGSDGSTAGVHLRWDFFNLLGNTHLPKGNLASQAPYLTNQGFNKPNDFVKLYSVPYLKKYPIIINLRELPLANFKYISQYVSIKQSVNMLTITGENIERVVELRFEAIAFTIARQSGYTTEDVLKNYTGLIEIEVVGLPCFSTTIKMQITDLANSNFGTLRTESISYPDVASEIDPLTGEEKSNLFVSCRHQFEINANEDIDSKRPIIENTVFLEPENAEECKIVAENIQYIRFDYQNAFPIEIKLETYNDFITGVGKAQNWESQGEFALSINDPEVENRLDNTKFNINGNWPRFNKNEKYPTAFKVRTQNYLNKWNIPYEGTQSLKEGVKNYLTKSAEPDNLTAVESINLDADNTDIENQDKSINEYSYLDMLNIVSSDFHVARMLGLGHIHAEENAGDMDGISYVYLAVYETFAGLSKGEKPENIKHLFMTIPTSKTDQRLPEVPELKPVEYGLTISSPGEKISLTDENGYLPDGTIRYIRLYRKNTDSNISFEKFYHTPDDFNIDSFSKPIFYGLEYKKQGEENWQVPVLSKDTKTIDIEISIPLTLEEEENRIRNSMPPYVHKLINYDVIPLLNPSDSEVQAKEIYTHKAEKDKQEEGIHSYAIYGINSFSRISALSNEVTTNETIFPIKYNLLPPSDFTAQLILQEDVLVLTSAQDQLKLSELTTTDKTLVRITFSWNHIHNIEHQFANKVQLLFRKNAPTNIRGKIDKITDLGSNKISVELVKFLSESKNENIIPIIADGINPENFIGGVFISDENKYEIKAVNVISVGERISFTLTKLKKLITYENSDNQFKTVYEDLIPEVGKISMAIENMAKESSWNYKLEREISLNQFTTKYDNDGNLISGDAITHTETSVDSEGNIKILNCGGIFEKATVTERLEKYTQEEADADLTDNIIKGGDKRTGVYDVIFENNNVLPNSIDPTVEWFNGIVRIDNTARKEENKEKKILNVLEIKKVFTGHGVSNLTLVVYDPNFVAEGVEFPIKTGAGIMVNFHPGYKTYLYAEPNLKDSFVSENIMPISGLGPRQTFLGIKSIDTNKVAESRISSPTTIVAYKNALPVRPGASTGAEFATRPDFYGKSSYTMDCEVDKFVGDEARLSNSLVFYRANEQSILDILYSAEKVELLQSQIKLLSKEDAVFMPDLWRGLINVKFDETGEFFTDIAGKTPIVFKFPVPNNTEYYIPVQNLDITKIKPFDGTKKLTDTILIDGEQVPMKKIVQEAILSAFTPITKQPILYRDIKEGTQTSGKAPKVYDDNGNSLFGTVDYDPYPMAVYKKGRINTTIRITDYSLDGTSINIYFYYAVELTPDFKFGEPNQIHGPVRLVNSFPPEAPGVKKITSQVANPINGEATAVKIEVNSYIESENISHFRIYRATSFDDSKNIRTMTLAKRISKDEALIDDFSDLDFPPYGDPIFYRIVAIRTIKNEQNLDEEIPSKPSEPLLASVVDVVNPESPEITYISDDIAGNYLQNVRLNWKKTAHNATYYLYKMTSSGNWQLLNTTKTNDKNIFYQAGNLLKIDDDGNTIYHRFKVNVENASGLLNIEEKTLTI